MWRRRAATTQGGLSSAPSPKAAKEEGALPPAPPADVSAATGGQRPSSCAGSSSSTSSFELVDGALSSRASSKLSLVSFFNATDTDQAGVADADVADPSTPACFTSEHDDNDDDDEDDERTTAAADRILHTGLVLQEDEATRECTCPMGDAMSSRDDADDGNDATEHRDVPVEEDELLALREQLEEVAVKLLDTGAALVEEQAARRRSEAEVSTQRALVQQLVALAQQEQPPYHDDGGSAETDAPLRLEDTCPAACATTDALLLRLASCIRRRAAAPAMGRRRTRLGGGAAVAAGLLLLLAGLAVGVALGLVLAPTLHPGPHHHRHLRVARHAPAAPPPAPSSRHHHAAAAWTHPFLRNPSALPCRFYYPRETSRDAHRNVSTYGQSLPPQASAAATHAAAANSSKAAEENPVPQLMLPAAKTSGMLALAPPLGGISYERFTALVMLGQAAARRLLAAAVTAPSWPLVLMPHMPMSLPPSGMLAPGRQQLLSPVFVPPGGTKAAATTRTLGLMAEVPCTQEAINTTATAHPVTLPPVPVPGPHPPAAAAPLAGALAPLAERVNVLGGGEEAEAGPFRAHPRQPLHPSRAGLLAYRVAKKVAARVAAARRAAAQADGSWEVLHSAVHALLRHASTTISWAAAGANSTTATLAEACQQLDTALRRSSRNSSSSSSKRRHTHAHDSFNDDGHCRQLRRAAAHMRRAADVARRTAKKAAKAVDDVVKHASHHAPNALPVLHRELRRVTGAIGAHVRDAGMLSPCASRVMRFISKAAKRRSPPCCCTT